MAKLIVSIVSLLMFGIARAVEIADAPMPEPNYLGIVVFLLLFVGGSVWFLWMLMRKKDKDKK